MRRSTITSGTLALATAGALALTGCTTTHDKKDGSTEKPTKAPAAELADAANRLKSDTFTMTMTLKIDTTSAKLTGAMDPAKKTGSFTATTDDNGTTSVAEWRILGGVVYFKSNTPGLRGNQNKPWRKIDETATGGTFAGSFDGAKMAGPLSKALTVQRSGDRHFTGTFDTAALGQALSITPPSPGPSASPAPTVAFTADLDSKGRLTHYHLDVPRTKGGTYPMDLAFSDFGTPVTVQAPPADQVTESTPN
jgi:hypothetical protein